MVPVGTDRLTSRSVSDFDGDGKTDLAVFRPEEGGWYVRHSASNYSDASWAWSPVG